MLVNLRHFDGPLHRRLYQGLKSAIGDGRLAPHARLPSTRALATDLGISRNTVTLAYEQLVAEGYLVSRDRSAASVAKAPPSIRSRAATARAESIPRLSAYGHHLARDPAMPPSGTYAPRPGIRWDFRYGRPSIDVFPRETWRRLLAGRARLGGADALGYGPPAGYAPLRAALTQYLARARGLACDASQIVIVSGAQQAFDLAARVLVDAGDRVVIEEPHYNTARMTFEAAGARLVGITVDSEGLDTAQLPRASERTKLACVTPCHQFPTGVIMPLGRRLALLDWAQRSGAWILEDDYVSEFRYEGQPIEALQSLDRTGRVVHIGTFSKTLVPALRIAYLVLPPALVQPFTAAKWMADRYTAVLGQEVLAEFIGSGHYERYLRRARARNGERRRVLIAALQEHFGDRVEISGGNAGVHLLVWLNDVPARSLGSVITRAAEASVGLYSAMPYYLKPPERAGLLFGYASLSESAIRAGIKRLAALL
jgi:GntR family transcriptional regulator/MocR family aminotransferase